MPMSIEQILSEAQTLPDESKVILSEKLVAIIEEKIDPQITCNYRNSRIQLPTQKRADEKSSELINQAIRLAAGLRCLGVFGLFGVRCYHAEA
jgi:hypothetical protein